MRTKLLPFFLLTVLSLLIGTKAFATDFYWVGGGANPNWNNKNNWREGSLTGLVTTRPFPGDNVFFLLRAAITAKSTI